MTLRFAPLLLVACASTTYAGRPYRFDSPQNVATETQRVAMRMSGRSQTHPALVDPRTGTVYAAWRMTGFSEEITLFPPGEIRRWHVVRYRAFVRPNGPASAVFVDLEQWDCDSRGFAWSAVEIHGSCRPVTTMTAEELRALDELGASLGR